MKQRGPDLEGGLQNQPLRPMIIGRWSEFRGSHLAPVARWALAMVISGEVEGPLVGTLVGVSVLRN